MQWILSKQQLHLQFYPILQWPFHNEDVEKDHANGWHWLYLNMAKRVRIFWPDLKNTWPKPFFFTRSKNGLTSDLTRVFCESTRLGSQPDPNHFLKLVFDKKKKKLRQYWFNYLLWVLRKQLRHLYNCMQINWKMNVWVFCNE